MTEPRTPAPDLPGGRLATWIRSVLDAQVSDAGVDVPCGDCTACCRSSYFVHIEADEVAALRAIPRALLFPAPGLPKGNVVMGFDESGRCPMLVDGTCSIYEHRPRTCRRYDCRVFPAAGLSADDDGKPLIAERARRWVFDLPAARDRELLDATRVAAAFLRDNPGCVPDGAVPASTTQLAMLAVKAHEAFLDQHDAPTADAVRAAIRARSRER